MTAIQKRPLFRTRHGMWGLLVALELFLGGACHYADAGLSGDFAGIALDTSTTRSLSDGTNVSRAGGVTVEIPVNVVIELLPGTESDHLYSGLFFKGNATFEGFALRTIFSNSVRSSSEYEADDKVDNLIELQKTLTIPPQEMAIVSPDAGFPDLNYVLRAQLLSGDNTALSNSIFVCTTQSINRRQINISGYVRASVVANITSVANDARPVPYFEFSCSWLYDGLKVRFSLSPEDKTVGGESAVKAFLDYPIIGPGTAFETTGGEVSNDLGGNPWVISGFVDLNGAQLSQPVLLGRFDALHLSYE